MKRFKYEFEISDNWEQGDCFTCKFSYYNDNLQIICALGGNCSDTCVGCPLVEVKDE